MQYFLGTLSPAEIERMDDALFADDHKLEELEIAETELVDAYVRRDLSAEDLKRFEERLQKSPALAERVLFARELEKKITDSPGAVAVKPEPKANWWRQLFAQPVFASAVAAGLLIIVGGASLFFAWRSARNDSNKVASERAALIQESKAQQQQSAELKAKADRLAADLQTERSQREGDRKLIEQLQREQVSVPSFPAAIASILLTPGSLRSSGSAQELTLRGNTTTAQLKLSIGATGHSSYRATIETAEGRGIASQDRLKLHKGILLISLPAQHLPPGDYLVHVDGIRAGEKESVADYQFRVLRPR